MFKTLSLKHRHPWFCLLAVAVLNPRALASLRAERIFCGLCCERAPRPLLWPVQSARAAATFVPCRERARCGHFCALYRARALRQVLWPVLYARAAATFVVCVQPARASATPVACVECARFGNSCGLCCTRALRPVLWPVLCASTAASPSGLCIAPALRPLLLPLLCVRARCGQYCGLCFTRALRPIQCLLCNKQSPIIYVVKKMRRAGKSHFTERTSRAAF